jgi:hypothetical protein
LAVAFFCSIRPAGAAEATPAAAAKEPAIVETFSSSVDPKWRVAKGDWKIVDGAWRGAELPADKHGAVARRPLSFTDGVIEFDFRLDGAKGISLSINDAKGHVCRLAIRPTGFTVTKDDHDHDGPDKRAVLANDERAFATGTWYHARVELAGRKMTARIDEGSRSSDGSAGRVVGGEHEMIAVPKANFGLTVAGATASFRNLKVVVK